MKKGWQVKKLNDVCDSFIVPQRDKPKEFSGNVPWCRIEDFDGKYLSKSKTDKCVSQELIESMPLRVYPINTVIVSCSADLGRCAIIKKPLVTNQTFIGLVPKKEIYPEYLYYLMGSMSNYLNKIATGATIKYLSKKKFENLEIPIPSIEEQQQIVAILDKAFTAIDQAKVNIEKNIENAKELFQSKLNVIFSQKGDGWEEKTLGELGKVSMCKRISKKQTSPDGEIPFYKIGTFGKEPNAFISKEIYDDFRSKYSFPKKGDILFSASGTIGRRVIYNGEPAYFQDSNIVWIDNNEELVTNEYLYHFYGVCDFNPSKGATISRLYNADLRKIQISFPSIEEQNLIIPKMIELSNQTLQIESNYKQKIEDLEELKKSMLQKAFTGELTKQLIMEN